MIDHRRCDVTATDQLFYFFILYIMLVTWIVSLSKVVFFFLLHSILPSFIHSLAISGLLVGWFFPSCSR